MTSLRRDDASFPPADLSGAVGDDALLALLDALAELDYRFVTPTPATHARVLSNRSSGLASDLRDIFGWSMAFDRQALDPELLELLRAADGLTATGDGRFKSRYRVASLDRTLLLHSAYPTDADNAVFFGPDSYRFVELIRREVDGCLGNEGARLVDIGGGTGVGAIVAGQLCPSFRLAMSDINPEALRLARINARHAGVELEMRLGPGFQPLDGEFDIALANPPYMMDEAGRGYRDGGDMHGARVAYDMACEAIDRLRSGGRFILYTGSAIVDGEDALREALLRLAADRKCAIRYREIDPDIFGEELETPAYRDVERIAAVGAVITRLS